MCVMYKTRDTHEASAVVRTRKSGRLEAAPRVEGHVEGRGCLRSLRCEATSLGEAGQVAGKGENTPLGPGTGPAPRATRARSRPRTSATGAGTRL